MLLEVLLALSILFVAGGVITGSMRTSIEQVNRIKLQARASDLAVSVLSQVQMGVLEPISAGPEVFEPDEPGWVWEVIADPAELADTGLSQMLEVKVIVRHEPTGFSYRIAQWLPQNVDDEAVQADVALPRLAGGVR